MRCYFLRDGPVAGVEMLTGLSDEDAFRAQIPMVSRFGISRASLSGILTLPGPSLKSASATRRRMTA